ncbi:YihY/virulence factor BrkB family protein [Jatrophihabitans endophyticus]|uniref:YihY/virulence factor BrkB family protein n=1 Tax=Jatrophihabitans endophyticus TaxID=1206085 RepID=UPI0019DAABB2|nr:YihY/virulence factor BrkB family protein [Jatrophihabitans endophyticus]MBE7186862.1 YihY/virulence factor BrkB family protein [Jatrophihabitans endophyticus]
MGYPISDGLLRARKPVASAAALPVPRIVRRARYLPQLLRRAVVKAWQDRVLGLSAEAAFWQMLSLPSLFLALVATLGYVSRWFGPGTAARTEHSIEDVLSRAFGPQIVHEVVSPILHEVLSSDRAGVISVGFVLALWAGSSATATFVNTVTIAYDQRDLRGPVRSRLLALWLFLATVVLGVLLLPMLVLGPGWLRKAFPAGVRPTVSTLLGAGYYPVLIALLLLGLTTFYRLALPRRLPWHRGLPGAVFALLVFLGGSAALRAYIAFILDKNHAYGTLAAPIAALLYFFVLALGVLLGAELNAAVEDLKPARAAHTTRLLYERTRRRIDRPEPTVATVPTAQSERIAS